MRDRSRRLAAASLLVVTLMSAACGSTQRTGQIVAAPRQTSSAAAAAVDIDFIPSLFPAAGAEFQNPKSFSWLQFVSGVQRASVYACMQKQGFTADEIAYLRATSNPPALVDNTQFPNVTMLESGSFGTSDSGPAVANPQDVSSPNVPASEQAAFQKGVQTCSIASAGPFDGVNRALQPIQQAWGEMTSKVDADPAVSSASAAWRGCMSHGGVSTSSLTDFFGQVDALSQRLGAHPNEQPPMEQMAKLYGRCIAPVAEAMDTVRLRDRKQLLDQYATQLDALQQQMNQLVTELSTRYGVKVTPSH